MHSIMSDAICASIESPSALSHVPRSFADHHSQPRGASVEHHAFNHFFTPRARPGDEHNVPVGKSVFGQAPPVLRFKHNNVVAEEPSLGSAAKIEQRNTRHHKPLL
jgi:hypothetical protein